MASALSQTDLEDALIAALDEMRLTPAQFIAALQDCGCHFDLPREDADNARDLWSMAREFIIDMAERDSLQPSR